MTVSTNLSSILINERQLYHPPIQMTKIATRAELNIERYALVLGIEPKPAFLEELGQNRCLSTGPPSVFSVANDAYTEGYPQDKPQPMTVYTCYQFSGLSVKDEQRVLIRSENCSARPPITTTSEPV